MRLLVTVDAMKLSSVLLAGALTAITATANATSPDCSTDLGPALVAFVDADVSASAYSVASLPPPIPREAFITAEGKYAGRPFTSHSGLWTRGWTNGAPKPSLVERWFKDRPVSAASLFKGAEVAPPGTIPSGKPMIAATCPVVSEDDHSGLVLLTWFGGPLAYREQLLLFERDSSGTWTIVSTRLIRVS
jgi:hypothetical protein